MLRIETMKRHPSRLLRPWFALPTALLACAAVLAIGPRLSPPAAGAAQSPDSAAIVGEVHDAATGLPVPGAEVAVPDLGLEDRSDSQGRFGWSDIPLTEDRTLSLVRVTAAGFGEWQLLDARLLVNDTLILTVELGPDPVTIQVPAPRTTASDWPEAGGASALPDEPFDDSNLPLPGSIRVRVTGYPYCDTSRPYTVRTIDFKDYAKHVLPNEWVNSWPHESLRAGAMAVKMYAWSYIAIGGKWPDADVYDSTCDQVYNPAVAYASTNNAVDFTWNFRLLRNSDSNLFRTFYRAYLSQCPTLGTCMGQWETRDDAYDLLTWDEILRKYYYNSRINAVWNPPGGWSLRYYGNGYGDLDRVKVRIDDPA
ncbi:MAG: hypothetical protein MUO23_02820, partial [Anaerolineales bacterium]|nr:hypothetical protein [Anaerolineales bacterium]